MPELAIEMKRSPYSIERLRQSAIRRLHRLRTDLSRTLGPRTSEEEDLEERIRSRVKELGRKYEDGNSDLVSFTYHPIPFSGFEDIPCHRREVESRLQAMLTRLNIAPGDWVLDIGANVGFFAFSLERLGASVEAYEPNSPSFEIGAALSKLHKTNVLYINKAFSHDSLRYLRPRYKAVLLLSVFHWIVKQDGKEGGAQLVQELARRADLIFFEVPTSSSDGMFQDPLFASKESIDTFLAETLPGVPIHELAFDGQWGGRFLLCIDCRGVHPAA